MVYLGEQILAPKESFRLNKTHKIRAIALIAIMLGFGFFQEKLKIGINYIVEHASQVANYDSLSPENRSREILQLKEKENIPYDYYYAHNSLPILFNFSISALSKLKWGLGFAFIAIHFLAVWLILRWWFSEGISALKLIYIYLAILGLALFVYFIGKLLGHAQEAYAFARELLGGIQSLVPLMLLAPAMWLQSHFNSSFRKFEP